MKYDLMHEYKKFRAIGETALQAIRSARIVNEFKNVTELAGYRIVAEYDADCDIFDYDDERLDIGSKQRREYWRKHYSELAERTGCWIVSGKLNSEYIDSIGGCWGYELPTSPYENNYVIDIMAACNEHYRTAEAERNKPRGVIAYELIDHGIENSSYFQGCGTSFTDYTDVATGIGEDFAEALDDCLEMLAQSGRWEIELLETLIRYTYAKSIKKSSRVTSRHSEDCYYHVSIRVR